MKRKSRKSTTRELDKACREYVFKRDGHKCLRCQSTKNLQWAHVYSRRYRTVRWHPWGSMALCARCHFWWHAEPVAAVLWLEGAWGRERIGDLLLHRHKPKPPTPEEVLEALK